MRVFVTGATGFIGSAVVKELIAAGHAVTGLCRSQDKAAALTAAGAEVRHGSVDDPEGLAAWADAADGVIHLAFNHDFSKFAANCEADRRVIQALGSRLAGTNRPLLVTSGTAIATAAPGAVATEIDPPHRSDRHPRAASEEAQEALVAAGVNACAIRLPQVHDTARQGLITYLIAVAREKGVCAYVGEGSQRWAAAHVSDVAKLYALALERAEPGAKYHAVGEEGVSLREISQAFGGRLKLPVKSIAPEEAAGHFGWMAMFAGLDMPASSAFTREKLGWRPNGPGLVPTSNG